MQLPHLNLTKLGTIQYKFGLVLLAAVLASSAVLGFRGSQATTSAAQATAEATLGGAATLGAVSVEQELSSAARVLRDLRDAPLLETFVAAQYPDRWRGRVESLFGEEMLRLDGVAAMRLVSLDGTVVAEVSRTEGEPRPTPAQDLGSVDPATIGAIVNLDPDAEHLSNFVPAEDGVVLELSVPAYTGRTERTATPADAVLTVDLDSAALVGRVTTDLAGTEGTVALIDAAGTIVTVPGAFETQGTSLGAVLGPDLAAAIDAASDPSTDAPSATATVTGGPWMAGVAPVGLGSTAVTELSSLRVAEESAMVASARSFRNTSFLLVIGVAAAAYALGVWATRRIVVKPLMVSSDELSEAAINLASVSRSMGRSASNTSSQAHAATEAGDVVTANVDEVAVAIGQMKNSINEISVNAAEASGVAADAAEVATRCSNTIAEVDDASDEIGNVLQVIEAIAKQTNLLALNATIEAARAGDSGKGFAVVANEVKALASQTTNATQEVAEQIQNMQTSTAAAVAANQEIGTTIEQIVEISTTIASAVEEQLVTSASIGQNVDLAAGSAKAIAGNIAKVADVAKATKEATNKTSSAAVRMTDLADDLHNLVGQH